jgi:hypothetical protein
VASADDALVLIAAKTAQPSGSEFWLDALRPLVADVGATRWELQDAAAPGGPGPGHTHVVRLDSVAALTSYDGAVRAARYADALPVFHAEVRRDIWLRHGPTVDSPAEAVPTAMIAAEVLCTDSSRHDEWDRWYDDQHLSDMLASGAFVAASRWRRAEPRAGGTNDLTLYEIAGMTVSEAIERSASAMPDLIRAGRKHECHTGGLTMALSLVR